MADHFLMGPGSDFLMGPKSPVEHSPIRSIFRAHYVLHCTIGSIVLHLNFNTNNSIILDVNTNDFLWWAQVTLLALLAEFTMEGELVKYTSVHLKHM